jgi:hypothetical protein
MVNSSLNSFISLHKRYTMKREIRLFLLENRIKELLTHLISEDYVFKLFYSNSGLLVAQGSMYTKYQNY